MNHSVVWINKYASEIGSASEFTALDTSQFNIVLLYLVHIIQFCGFHKLHNPIHLKTFSPLAIEVNK